MKNEPQAGKGLGFFRTRAPEKSQTPEKRKEKEILDWENRIAQKKRDIETFFGSQMSKRSGFGTDVSLAYAKAHLGEIATDVLAFKKHTGRYPEHFDPTKPGMLLIPLLLWISNNIHGSKYHTELFVNDLKFEGDKAIFECELTENVIPEREIVKTLLREPVTIEIDLRKMKSSSVY